MCRTTLGILTVGTLVLAGCGSGGTTFANKPRPPSPINLSVYVNNARVSVSPVSVGAGPVVFVVTNAASQTESINVQGPGGENLATTGPINPQSTAQVTVDFRNPGMYSVATGPAGTTEAATTAPASIQPATIHIGAPRPSASNQLLQP
jgi:hypothetical protein